MARRLPAELIDGDPEVVVWLAGPDGNPVLPHRGRPENGVGAETATALARSAAQRLKTADSTPGHRPGGWGDRSRGVAPRGPGRAGAGLTGAGHQSRVGGRGEVLQALPIRPRAAAEVIIDGQWLTPTLPGLTVTTTAPSLTGGAGPEPGLDLGPFSWSVVVRTGLVARVAATLTVRPTPSANLTVIELIPDRIGRWQARAFVRVGVALVDRLGCQLVARA